MISSTVVVMFLLAAGATAYYLGVRRATAVVGGSHRWRQLHSRPTYYGALTGLWCAVPAFLVFVLWQVVEDRVLIHLVVSALPAAFQRLEPDRLNLVLNDIRNLISGNIVSGQISPAVAAAADHYRRLAQTSQTAMAVSVFGLALAGFGWIRHRIHPAMQARNHVERLIRWALVACSTLAVFTTIGIVFSVLYEAIRFFHAVPITDFLFGLGWSPQTAMRADQVGSSGAFGVVPVFMGTALISAIAMAVAVPIGLAAAIYMSEYANRRFRSVVKPLMEILAGIPTVVYGFFAALTVAPAIRDMGTAVGLDVASESALAAGLVMGIMIIPFVSSLSDDMIHAVPQRLRDGAYALGATPSESIRHVVLPAALPGIVGGVLLAVSRAIGETMIVVMAAGMAANLTVNPLSAVTTVTVQIVSLLVGDQEFDSSKTLAAFALGLLLFVVTLVLNVIALYVVRTYREQYE